MKTKLMCHLIAGYPTVEDSHRIAQTLIKEGCTYLEIQFPFSDPSADGSVIQEACTAALNAGFTVQKGFDLVARLTAEFDTPVFIMSYGTIACRHGLKDFIDRAKQAKAAGLIIPDLLPPDDEGLYALAKTMNMAVIPVFPVSVTAERLEVIKQLKTEYLYIALRRGITGSKTEISKQQIRFLEKLKQTGSTILAGFGIRERSQVEMISPHVDSAIIGSALVQEIKSAGNRYVQALQKKMKALLC